MCNKCQTTLLAQQLSDKEYLMHFKTINFACFLLLNGILGCASTPPSKTLPHSEVAVTSVDHANYRKYVGDDVTAVQEKLQRAKEAATNKDHLVAEQLAQQILLDVELVKLKTQRMNTEQEVKNLESSITNLHQELQWREPVQLSPLDQ